jgi:putative membrane protein
MPKVISITSVVAAAMLASAASASGQEVSSQDTTYINQAIQANYLEVALGRIAESRHENDAVGEFAEQMVSEHNEMNTRWNEVARSAGIIRNWGVPKLDPAAEESMERLEDLDGDEFDQEYMREMIRQHEQALAVFTRMSTSARSSEVRQLAGPSIARIRQHLTLAHQVGSQVGVSGVAGQTGGVTTAVPDTQGFTGRDSMFISQAIEANYLEVALGRIAESRHEDDAVGDFAERMVSEHSEMNSRWSELARNANLGTRWGVPQLSPTARATVDRLEDLDGDEFDQEYMGEMIRQHEQALAVFTRMSSSARSSDVRQLAGPSIARIRQHLTLARQVGSRVGVSTVAGQVGGVTAPDTSDDDRVRRRTDRVTRADRDDRADRRDDRGDRAGLRGEDRAFIHNVLQDHLMHIQLAQLARREARTNETRQLAQRMEDEFEDWQERWEDLAERYDVRVPSRLGPLHREKVDRLERTSKNNVDRTYTRIVTDHLESVVPYFEKEGQVVRPAAARQLVDDELPVIRKILTGVRGMREDARERSENSERR